MYHILLQRYAQISKWMAGVKAVLMTRLAWSVITMISKEERYAVATYFDTELLIDCTVKRGKSFILIDTFFA